MSEDRCRSAHGRTVTGLRHSALRIDADATCLSVMHACRWPFRGNWTQERALPYELAELSSRIVAAKGSIHIEEVARRVAACFGKKKAGSRTIGATRLALLLAQRREAGLLSEDGFWFNRAQPEAPPIWDRSAEGGATLKAACVLMLEIEAGLKIAADDNAGGSDANLVRTAARLLGFRRVGPDLMARNSGASQRVDAGRRDPAAVISALPPSSPLRTLVHSGRTVD